MEGGSREELGRSRGCTVIQVVQVGERKQAEGWATALGSRGGESVRITGVGKRSIADLSDGVLQLPQG